MYTSTSARVWLPFTVLLACAVLSAPAQAEKLAAETELGPELTGQPGPEGAAEAELEIGTAAAAATVTPPYRTALLPVPARPGYEQAAAFITAAVRDALSGDPRFTLLAHDAVAATGAFVLPEGGVYVLKSNMASRFTAVERVDLGVADHDEVEARACLTAHAIQAPRVLLLGGYQQTARRPGNGDEGYRVTLAASMITLDAECEPEEQSVVRVAGSSLVSLESARARAEQAFRARLPDVVAKLFPVQAQVRVSTPLGGFIDHGRHQGVREGEYYSVHRSSPGGDARVVGSAFVEVAAEDSATVSLVRGTPALRPGDHLIEREPVALWTLSAGLSPLRLAHRDGSAVTGVAPSVEVSRFRPVSGPVYSLWLDYLRVPDLSRSRAGVEVGWQSRLIPRRLFGYAQIGLGVMRGAQNLPVEVHYEEADITYSRTLTRGFELHSSAGLRGFIGEHLVLGASVALTVPLHGHRWYADVWDLLRVDEELLGYREAGQRMPTVMLSAGWCL
ncbi:hypothetical protein [Haliangium ochraceum]|uniref:Uncharacterized protein n=1 Tax=Haliangium ochraceum (strain DSM 14365 / JCM 11303 / SMP-2) TaxID=502025 RepID=D0LM91_HALO1|nr:hypothetical protein [Haliangium ochraceum]ACY16797.1 hypothetical protein Hoch_4301 [Haliangium ochraceum DSM 14365]